MDEVNLNQLAGDSDSFQGLSSSTSRSGTPESAGFRSCSNIGYSNAIESELSPLEPPTPIKVIQNADTGTPNLPKQSPSRGRPPKVSKAESSLSLLLSADLGTESDPVSPSQLEFAPSPVYMVPPLPKRPTPLCALCALPNSSLLGQGELSRYEPTPDYNPWRDGPSCLDLKPDPQMIVADDQIEDSSHITWRRNRSPGKKMKTGSWGLDTKRFSQSAQGIHDQQNELESIGWDSEPSMDSVDSLFEATGHIWVHRCCAAWSHGVEDTPDYQLLNVDKGVVQGLSQLCGFCQHYGATIHCREPNCNNKYHYPCAAASGCFQDFQTLTLFCPEHIYQAPAFSSLDSSCVVCDEPGDLMLQLFCTSCGQHYHGQCLDPTVEVNAIVRGGWQCPECKICQTCRHPGDDNKMLVCDTCDKGYHTFCLKPPVMSIPKNGWKCAFCRKCYDCGNRTPGSGPSSRWHLNFSVCDSCYQQRNKGLFCPLCGRAYRHSASQAMVQCRRCKKHCHISCDGDYSEHGGPDNYVCTVCRTNVIPDVNSITEAQSSMLREIAEAAKLGVPAISPLLESSPLSIPLISPGLSEPSQTLSFAEFKTDEREAFGNLNKLNLNNRSTTIEKPTLQVVPSAQGATRRGRRPLKIGLHPPDMDSSMDYHDGPRARREEDDDGSPSAILVLTSTEDTFTLSQDMCVSCGSFGKGKEGQLIACSQCGECFHPYCAGVKLTNTAIEKGWRCLDCTVCEGCGKASDEACLLLCDDCETSYHTYCLEPPLITVPSGGWKCSRCVYCQECGITDPGWHCHWENNYTKCTPCASIYNCPSCRHAYQEGELIIQCSQCERWLHGSCDSLNTEEDLDRESEKGYKCLLCRPFLDTSPLPEPEPNKIQIQFDYNPTPSIQKSVPCSRQYTVEGVRLTEWGLQQIRSLQMPSTLMNSNPKTKRSRSLGTSASSLAKKHALKRGFSRGFEIKPGLFDSDESGGCDSAVDYMADNEALDGIPTVSQNAEQEQKRRYKFTKPGIGGFIPKMRGPKKSASVHDDPTLEQNDPTSDAPRIGSKKRRARKKPGLETIYPAYLQEAFFGKSLLQSYTNTVPFDKDTVENISLVNNTDTGLPQPDIPIDPFVLPQDEMLFEIFNNDVDISNTLTSLSSDSKHVKSSELSGDALTENLDSLLNSMGGVDDLFSDVILNEKHELPVLPPNMHLGISSNSTMLDLGIQNRGSMIAAPQTMPIQQPLPTSVTSTQSSMEYRLLEQQIFQQMIEVQQLQLQQQKISVERASMPNLTMSLSSPLVGHAVSQVSTSSQITESTELKNTNGSSNDDVEKLSNNAKMFKKWESDESLGVLSTISPVLYCNVQCPNLKEDNPDWPARFRKITKMWRMLTNDEKAPYLQLARENRATLRIRQQVEKNQGSSKPKSPRISHLVQRQVHDLMSASSGESNDRLCDSGETTPDCASQDSAVSFTETQISDTASDATKSESPNSYPLPLITDDVSVGLKLEPSDAAISASYVHSQLIASTSTSPAHQLPTEAITKTGAANDRLEVFKKPEIPLKLSNPPVTNPAADAFLQQRLNLQHQQQDTARVPIDDQVHSLPPLPPYKQPHPIPLSIPTSLESPSQQAAPNRYPSLQPSHSASQKEHIAMWLQQQHKIGGGPSSSTPYSQLPQHQAMTPQQVLLIKRLSEKMLAAQQEKLRRQLADGTQPTSSAGEKQISYGTPETTVVPQIAKQQFPETLSPKPNVFNFLAASSTGNVRFNVPPSQTSTPQTVSSNLLPLTQVPITATSGLQRTTSAFQTGLKPTSGGFQTGLQPTTVSVQNASQSSTGSFLTSLQPATSKLHTDHQPITCTFQTGLQPRTSAFQTDFQSATSSCESSNTPSAISLHSDLPLKTASFQHDLPLTHNELQCDIQPAPILPPSSVQSALLKHTTSADIWSTGRHTTSCANTWPQARSSPCSQSITESTLKSPVAPLFTFTGIKTEDSPALPLSPHGNHSNANVQFSRSNEIQLTRSSDVRLFPVDNQLITNTTNNVSESYNFNETLVYKTTSESDVVKGNQQLQTAPVTIDPLVGLPFVDPSIQDYLDENPGEDKTSPNLMDESPLVSSCLEDGSPVVSSSVVVPTPSTHGVYVPEPPTWTEEDTLL